MSRIKVGVLTVLVAGMLSGCANMHLSELKPAYTMDQYAEYEKKWLTQAGGKPSPTATSALVNLAEMHCSGFGTPANAEKCQDYQKRLSAMSPQGGKIMLANAYFRGWKQFGIPGQDLYMAKKLYDEANLDKKDPLITSALYLNAMANYIGYFWTRLDSRPQPERISALYRAAEPYFNDLKPNNTTVLFVKAIRGVSICSGGDPEIQDKKVGLAFVQASVDAGNTSLEQFLPLCKSRS